VSRRLREDFHNGEYYRQLDGSEIWVPRRREERPDPAFLEWHADVVSRG